MPGELFEWALEGARDPVSGRLNQRLILPRTAMVPKNSNIQLVWPDIMDAIARAKRFKPPFRNYAIEMAMNDLEGVLSISSEQGAFVREFSTMRAAAPMGQVTGQPATWFDEYVYGKQKLKNNPKQGGLGMDF